MLEVMRLVAIALGIGTVGFMAGMYYAAWRIGGAVGRRR